MPDYDALVIGSGLAGVNAAYPLVHAGLSVAMLDVGIDEHATLECGPALRFEECRRTDPEQYRIFLGEDLSGIGAETDGRGIAMQMMSGRRGYIARGSEQYGPLELGDSEVVQSFACGGFSEAWSGVSDFFNADECRAVGLPVKDMEKAYGEIAERIGMSGEHPVCPLQPPATIDDNAKDVLRRYALREERVRTLGFRVERPLFAMLTKDKDGRKGQEYRDMDFWDSIGRSLYRARYTLEELKRHQNFTYVSGVLVQRVRQESDQAIAEAVLLVSGEPKEFRAKIAIMAAGTINTVRILLRSFKRYEELAPVILKNHSLIPCLQLSRIGKVTDPRRYSFAQLVMHALDTYNGMRATYVQLVTYNSLLLYKLLGHVPLSAPEALGALSVIAPAFVIADVRFHSTSRATCGARLCKRADGSDYLAIEYQKNAEDQRMERQELGKVKSALRALGLMPIATIRSPYGGASHYAGGIPVAETPDSEHLSVNERGQLHGAPRIFIADSATWKALPASPPSLTLMTNAYRIGKVACDFLSTKK